MHRSARWRHPSALAAVIGLASGPALAGSADLVRVKAAMPQSELFAPDLALTGAIAARIQTNVAFRASGKVTARRVEVGQHVAADDVLATLDPKERQADVDNAQAALTSAQAQLQQAELTFGRQRSLLESGYATRASFDQAQEALNTSQAQLRSAQAALNTAREQLSYTELKAGRNGIIVSRAVEVGQVVQAGQTVFVLAEDGPRDAVFNVPEALLTTPPADRTVDVALQADPAVATAGAVREISPILDPATSTVTVKIGLASTPPAMTLGAAVVGRAHWRQQRVFRLPWSALFESEGKPAVWLLDAAGKVSLQPVEVQSYATGAVLLRGGVPAGQRVVTAGGQLLYPGQTVTVAGTTP
jgi:RND family efflux transporter MFP subunit